MAIEWPTPANIAQFSYSRRSSFELFRGPPYISFNGYDPDPDICDLKVYQDYLTYCFIRQNVPKGSRILEVGGGDSRILKVFAQDYECWNADKCDGLGNGPTKFSSPHYRLVYDYVGSYNPELPAEYFDFVFSISALEHTPEDQAVWANVLGDISRVLKPGGSSLHCFDAIIRPAGKSWVSGLIPYLYANAPVQTRFAPLSDIELDPDTFAMSKAAYEEYWQPVTKESYENFGRPFSINIFWTKGT